MSEPLIDVEFTPDEAEVLRDLHASMADNIRAQIVAELAKIEGAERRLMRTPGLNLQARSRYQERADALMAARRVIEAMRLSLD